MDCLFYCTRCCKFLFSLHNHSYDNDYCHFWNVDIVDPKTTVPSLFQICLRSLANQTFRIRSLEELEPVLSAIGDISIPEKETIVLYLLRLAFRSADPDFSDFVDFLKDSKLNIDVQRIIIRTVIRFPAFFVLDVALLLEVAKMYGCPFWEDFRNLFFDIEHPEFYCIALESDLFDETVKCNIKSSLLTLSLIQLSNAFEKCKMPLKTEFIQEIVSMNNLHHSWVNKTVAVSTEDFWDDE